MIRDDGKLWPEAGDRIVSPSGVEWDIEYLGTRKGRFAAVADLRRVSDGKQETWSAAEVYQCVQRHGWSFDRDQSRRERTMVDVVHERAVQKRQEGER